MSTLDNPLVSALAEEDSDESDSVARDSDYDPDASSEEDVEMCHDSDDDSSGDDASSDASSEASSEASSDGDSSDESNNEEAPHDQEVHDQEVDDREEKPAQKRRRRNVLSKDERRALLESDAFVHGKRTDSQIKRTAWTKLCRVFDGGVAETYTLIAAARINKADTALNELAKRAIKWALDGAKTLKRTDDVNAESLNEGARGEYGTFVAARAGEAEFGGGTSSAEAAQQEAEQMDRIRASTPWTISLDLDTYIKMEQAEADVDTSVHDEGGAGGGGEGVRPVRAAKRKAVQSVREAVQADVRDAAEAAGASAAASAAPSRLRDSMDQATHTNLIAHVLGYSVDQLTALRRVAVDENGGTAGVRDERQRDCDMIAKVTKRMSAGMRAVAVRCHDELAGITAAGKTRSAVNALFEANSAVFPIAADMSALTTPCDFTGLRLYDNGVLWSLHKVVIGDETVHVVGAVATLLRALHEITHPLNIMRDKFNAWCTGDEDTPLQNQAYLRFVGAARLLSDNPDDTTNKLLALDEATQCANEFLESTVGDSIVDSAFTSLNYITAFLASVRSNSSELHRALREHAAAPLA